MAEEVKFEKSLEELRGIVEKLERGGLELDESLKLFERGVKLIGVCTRRLDDAQRRVDQALKGKDGSRILAEFWEETEPDLEDEEDAAAPEDDAEEPT
jgi:exodeoxyribonuclease VII small subunit